MIMNGIMLQYLHIKGLTEGAKQAWVKSMGARTMRKPLWEVTESLSSLSTICCAFSDLLSCVGAFSCSSTVRGQSLLVPW